MKEPELWEGPEEEIVESHHGIVGLRLDPTGCPIPLFSEENSAQTRGCWLIFYPVSSLGSELFSSTPHTVCQFVSVPLQPTSPPTL